MNTLKAVEGFKKANRFIKILKAVIAGFEAFHSSLVEQGIIESQNVVENEKFE